MSNILLDALHRYPGGSPAGENLGYNAWDNGRSVLFGGGVKFLPFTQTAFVGVRFSSAENGSGGQRPVSDCQPLREMVWIRQPENDMHVMLEQRWFLGWNLVTTLLIVSDVWFWGCAARLWRDELFPHQIRS